MDERTWERIKEIFHEAVALPAAQRRTFVKRACGGDASLCAEVAELLSAHEEAALFEPAAAPAKASARAEAGGAAEAQIGPYKLLQRIGEGGFGVVYMAEQTEPVRRIVALKIIKLGMDTKQVIARFEAERQALALMDHPNIARVLDAGATATGRPYFVMELVKGVPITEYCDANNLGTRERLLLFIDVCHAVRHAHQKGVIHRDIKPSNVMVTLHDGVPVPKVIDFGIAKATATRLTDKTLFTEFKQFLGTPEYMSPEQAEMSGLDIDTRADIYSLGVLLYELLTGTTPFDAKTLRAAAYDEILRILRESEPQKPSTRVSTLGERVTDVARHRGTEPRALNRLLLGDLDWIVMKALEKDRTRRYESADGLAQDVDRHLRDEPVLASPPSAAYKLRKFAKRHRTMIGAFSAVAAALVLGLAAATFGLLRARSERDRALVAETSAGREAERAEKVNTFLRRFLTAPSNPWASTPGAGTAAFGPDVKVVDVVDDLVKALDKELAGEPVIEADVRIAIAESYQSLSRYVDAEVQLRRAIELRARISGGEDMPTMNCLSSLGGALAWQGRFDEADDCFLHAIEGCRRLVGERADETLSAELAYVMFLMDKDGPEAEPRARHVVELSREIRGEEAPETLKAQAALAFTLNSAGKPSEGEALARETLATVQRTLGDDVGLCDLCVFVLGNAALARGDPVEAERCFRENLERAKGAGREELFVGSVAAAQLALALGAQGRWAEAEALDRKASAAYLRNFGGAHPYTFTAFGQLGRALYEQGKYDEAERCYRELVDICARSSDAQHLNLREPDANRLFARHLRRMGRVAEAEPFARAAVEGCRRRQNVRRSADPDGLDSGMSLVRALGLWGQVLADLGRAEEAERAFDEALEFCSKLRDDEDVRTLTALESFGVLLDEQGRYADAGSLFRRVLDGRRRALGEDDEAALIALNNVAWNLHRLGRDAEAEPLAREAVEDHARFPHPSPTDRVLLLDTLACILNTLGRSDEAEALFVEIEGLERSAPEATREPEILLHHGECLLALHRTRESRERIAEAHAILSARGQGDSLLARTVAARLAEIDATLEHARATGEPSEQNEDP